VILMAGRFRCLLAQLAISVLAAAPLSAAWPQDASFGALWGAHVSVAYSSWDNLGNVQPAGRGGPFKTRGTGIEFGGYTSLARWGPARVLLGAELGFMGFNADVIFEADGKAESAMETTYISTSAKFRFGEPASRYLDLDMGLGWYQADTKYIDCAAIPACLGAETRSSTIGASAGVRAMLGRGFFTGARIHIVDFDPIQALGPATGGLDGPIYSVFVGWEFANWERR
jgi:hypothetical protein